MVKDTSGRDFKKEAYWRRQIERWRSSGLSIRRFCRSARTSEALFYYWRRTVARRDGQSGERGGSSFVPVRVTGDEPMRRDGKIEIILAGGRCVRVSGQVDGQMLAEVLAVVEGRGC